MTFRQGNVRTSSSSRCHPESRVVGNRVDAVVWPMDTALVAIVREGRVITPTPTTHLEVNDELLFVSAQDQEEARRLACGLVRRGPPWVDWSIVD